MCFQLYIVTHDVVMHYLFNYAFKFGNGTGFEVVDKGCCGVGRNNGQITCLPLQQACEDRRKYLFWDAFHPTELANIYFTKNSYSS